MNTLNLVKKNGVYSMDKGIDFKALKNAINDSMIKVKGKLSNGVKWAWDPVSKVIKFSCRWSSEKITTMVDGVKQGWAWIMNKISNLFNKGEK